MADGGARISMVGLLPQEDEDEEEDAAIGGTATFQANSCPKITAVPAPGVTNEGFEPGMPEGEDNVRKKEIEKETTEEDKSIGENMEERKEEREEDKKEDKGNLEKGKGPKDPESEAKERVVGPGGTISYSRFEDRSRESKLEGKEIALKEDKKRSPIDNVRVPAAVVLGVAPILNVPRPSESPHRRRTAPSAALRRRRVEDSRSTTPLAAWGPPRAEGPVENNVPAVAPSSTPVVNTSAGTRMPSNSAPGPSRPTRRSSGPRCQEALSSILWEPYDCRRRRPTLLGGEGYRVHTVAPSPTFYYHAPLSHPLEDYALWLPPPPYEASAALPLDGPPPTLPDFFPITFSSCSSASSSAASSLSTSPSSSSSFLCCSTANGNTNRFSIDVATARRAAEKAAEEATEAALRRARSFQCLPPEGSCVAVVETEASRIPLATARESGTPTGVGKAGEAREDAGGEGAEGNRKNSALVADLGGEESWCPYCLARPREALGASRAPRGRCHCKSSSVECSLRWGSVCPSSGAVCGGASREEDRRVETRRGAKPSHSRCEGRERCPRRSRGKTPAADMVSVAVEGVRGGGASAAPPDEEAPPGAGEQNVGYGAGSATSAANGGDESAVVGVVNVVNCRAAAPATIRVPVPAAQRCVLVGNPNVSNVRISSESVVSPERGEGRGGEQGRTFTSTEAQTDETGGGGVGGGTAVVRGAEEAQVEGQGGVRQQQQLQENRERRRRERRERRHRRSVAGQPTPPPPPSMMHPMPGEGHWQTRLDAVIPCGVGGVMAGERLLPDLLNSHLPPPYSTLPMPPAPPPRLIPMVGGPPPPNGPQLMPPPPPPPPPGSPPQIGGMRFPFPTPPGRRCRGGVSRGSAAVGTVNAGSASGGHYSADEDGPPKSCCGLSAAGVGGAGQPASVRWFVLAIAFVGVCCALVGTVLGALKATGREHLTVSLLMIGVGIVLITVSGVAWRLTSHDAPSCRMMLGLGGSDEGAAPNRRFVPRLPPSYGRPHHPYAAMMYPEFQYRPPPPSYQASMQEYRLRLLLLDRHPGGGGSSSGGVMPPPPNPMPPPILGPPPPHAHQHHPHHQTVHTVSPPPTYRSYAGSTIREWRCRAGLGLRRSALETQDHSRPPSYRSRASSSARPTLDPAGGNGSIGQHSRDASLSLSYLSAASHEDAVEIRSGANPCDVSVINVNSPSSPINADNLVLMMVTSGEDGEEKKRAMDAEEQHQPTLLHRLCSEGKDPSVSAAVVHQEAHLVTIVQTADPESCGPSPLREHQRQQSQCTQGDAVIVTVSGSATGERIGPHVSGQSDGEIEILAHL